MIPTNLEDIDREPFTFRLITTGKEYRFNKFVTLADEAWCRSTLGRDFEDVLKEPKGVEEVVRIIYRLLDDDSKRQFLRQPVTFVDDSGQELKLELGGWELLMYTVTMGKEVFEIVKGVFTTLGASRPAVEKAEEELKKKMNLGLSIGQPSLTSSPAPTAGQPNTSSVAV